MPDAVIPKRSGRLLMEKNLKELNQYIHSPSSHGNAPFQISTADARGMGSKPGFKRCIPAYSHAHRVPLFVGVRRGGSGLQIYHPALWPQACPLSLHQIGAGSGDDTPSTRHLNFCYLDDWLLMAGSE